MPGATTGLGIELEKSVPVVTGAGASQGANMEISISRQDLLRELTATQSVVERKTTIPILSNFLIEAEDDRVTITATDLDQSIKTSCAAKVKKPGACTIRFRQISVRRATSTRAAKLSSRLTAYWTMRRLALFG